MKSVEEEWREIEGYPDYYVSNLGRIKSYKKETPTILKFGDVCGYYNVGLSKNGKSKTRRVHRIVAIAFLPRIEGLNEINHKDGDRRNNMVENLEWSNPKLNAIHRCEVLNHNILKGENGVSAKLSEKQVREIKILLRDTNLSQMELGRMYHIHNSEISNIKHGKTWKYITI